MGHEAFGVDLEALGMAEKGVRDAVDAIGENGGFAIGSYASADGLGMKEGVNRLAGDIGGEALIDAVKHFGEKWEWGVRHLVDEGVSVADALRDARGTYEKAEEAALDAFKYVAHACLGDPTEDSTAWQDKSAEELKDEVIPDWSPGSFVEADWGW